MTHRRSRILLIIPNLGSGGAQRVFHQHRDLLSDEFDVVACTFNFEGAFSHEINNGILSLDVPAGKNPVDKVTRFFQRVRKLRSLKKQHNIDVSVSHLEGADYVNILSRSGDRIILWIHGTKVYDQNIRGFTGWLRKNILIPRWYARADRIVCVSNGIAAELAGVNGLQKDKIVTVHNGVDVGSVREKAKEILTGQWSELFASNTVVVTHCRLAAQKNLVALIEIIARLKEIGSLKWLIVGDGEERQLLLDRCRKHDIQTYDIWSSMRWNSNYQVYFGGHHPNPLPLISNGTMYIQTSKWEGFPLSLCEALACHVPTMAADCFTGPREILAPELKQPVRKATHASAGILMPVPSDQDSKSIDLWANEIRKVVVDPTLLANYRQQASQQMNRFSEDTFRIQTIHQIHSVIR